MTDVQEAKILLNPSSKAKYRIYINKTLLIQGFVTNSEKCQNCSSRNFNTIRWCPAVCWIKG
jgi:hypothetical protein